MKYLLYILLLTPISLIGQSGVGKMVAKKATKEDIIICNHSNHYVPNYTPRKKYIRKILKSKPATFIPTYNNVPADFVEAIEFAFDVVSDFIASEVPIYVNVSYESLGGNALASAGPGGFFSNFPGAVYYNTFYPVALAEKLAGKALNEDGESDLNISINSGQSRWNTIPNNPNIGNNYDLATTLIHEVIHGLGFTAGSRYSNDGAGSLAATIFSRFIANGDGTNLLDGFIQNTQGLGRELTGRDLFFENADSTNDVRYELYAPGLFEEGSSISHLDRATYQSGLDRMMTPVADRGDIHYSAGISENILHAMGWNITSVVHDPLLFTEDVNEDYLVTATVNSDIGFDTSSLVLHYSTDSFNLVDITVPLDFNPNSEEYSFLLPATGEEIQYQYYFELDELNGIKRLVPARARETFFTYNLGADITPPVIEGHEQLMAINETDVQFTLQVNDIDDFFTGVDSSSLVAVVSLNGNLETIPFEVVEEEFASVILTTFEATYNRPEAFDVTDELLYKITLQDKASNTNEGSLPENGFYTIAINEVPEAVVTYTNDFEVETDDFSGSGFSIRLEDNFDGPAIHSRHPYPQAGNGNTLDFIYNLNQLILIDEENPVIKFDEIVIVETGEPGTTCRGSNCDDMFWDYVIVEGQKLGTSEWLPLLDAYDSRGNANFVNAYTNGQNGSQVLFDPRTISLIDFGSFDIGDQIFIRFRLFSDPGLGAWGWAIDNLRIQPLKTNTLDKEYVDRFDIYPNPISNSQLLNLKISLNKKLDGELSLVNAAGQNLINTKITNQDHITVTWDISSLASGVYFAQLQNNEGVSVRKIVVE